MGWNLFFKMNYREFREKLCEIARSTYVRNQFDAIFFWRDWEIIQHYGNDTYVLPIDDDDWLSPNVVSVIRKTIEERGLRDLFRWDIAYTSPMGDRTTLNYEETYASCCYLARMPFPMEYLVWHQNLVFQKHSWVPYDIKQVLAVKLHNISSISYLYERRKRIDMVVRIVKERKFLTDVGLLGKFLPEVKRYNELLEELYGSCRI